MQQQEQDETAKETRNKHFLEKYPFQIYTKKAGTGSDSEQEREEKAK